jgi:hypothetical protein
MQTRRSRRAGIGSTDFSTGGQVNRIHLVQTSAPWFIPNVFTFCAWIYLPAVPLADTSIILAMDTGSSAFSYFFIRNDGFPECNNTNGTFAVGGVVLNANTWYFVFGTCDGSTTTFGYRTSYTTFTKASDAHVFNTTTSGLTLWIGAAGNGALQMSGSIAGFKFYNYAKTLGQVMADSRQLAPITGDAVAYLPFRSDPTAPFDQASGISWVKDGVLKTSYFAPPVPEVLAPKQFSFDVPPSAASDLIPMIGGGRDPRNSVLFGL